MKGEVWTFKLKVTSDLSTIDAEKTAEYQFSVNLFDGCINDELSSPSSIEDFDYYIAATGLRIINPQTYTQSLEDCPVTWSLVAIDPDSGLEEALSAKQTSYVTLQNDGSI